MQTSEYFTSMELVIQEMKANNQNLTSKQVADIQKLEFKAEELTFDLESTLMNLDELFKEL